MADEKVFPTVSDSSTVTGPKRAEQKGSFIAETEKKAAYYGPAVYQILSFYSNYEPQTDTNVSWVPISQTKPNPKVFAIGIIPPAVNITGRVLDRSASVANITGDSQTGLAEGPLSDLTISVQTGAAGAELPDAFWQDYVDMCARLKVDPIEFAAVISKESHFNPSAQNHARGKEKPPVAQGLCQFIRKVGTGNRVGMSEETWNNFATLSAQEQLPYVERYYEGKIAGKSRFEINYKTFGAYNNPDGSAYCSKAEAEKWVASHPGTSLDDFRNLDKQDLAIQQNPRAAQDGRILKSTLDANLAGHPPQSIIDRINQFQTSQGATSSRVNDPLGDLDEVTDWVDLGSANASEARKAESKLGPQGLNETELGKRFLLAQQAEIKQTALALEALKSIPPLRLLVNPSSFRVSSEKLSSDGNWTRNGPIVEHWGENQDKIEASGKIAAFFAIDADSTAIDAQGEGPGLTRVTRQYSASYQNFLSLYLLYRNNANLYTSGLDFPDSKGIFQNRLSMVGSIYIYYDNVMYSGSFDNFNITENDTAPYTLEYNFQFTVRATFVLDRPPDLEPQARTFLQQNLHAGSTATTLPTTSGPTVMEEFSSVADAFNESIFGGG